MNITINTTSLIHIIKAIHIFSNTTGTPYTYIQKLFLHDYTYFRTGIFSTGIYVTRFRPRL